MMSHDCQRRARGCEVAPRERRYIRYAPVMRDIARAIYADCFETLRYAFAMRDDFAARARRGGAARCLT